MTGPMKKSAVSGPVLWVVLGLLAIGGGGGYYLYLQNQAVGGPEVPNPTPPTTGPVESGRPLVVKELPFLTTSNRKVNVVTEGGTTTSVGPSNRTSNPFIQVVVPVTEGTGTSTPTATTQPGSTSGDSGTNGGTTPVAPFPMPVQVDNGPVMIPDTTGTLPTAIDRANNASQSISNAAGDNGPIVLPGGTGTVPGGAGGTGTTKTTPPTPPKLPAPSVVQPGTSTSSFSVPDQQTTVITADTPVLISSLVLPQPKASTPDATEPKPSELMKVSQDLQLAFSSVVIGPNSTAVFNSKNGYLMAAAGQKLAGTDIVVKSISQQQVTLQLGEETLELNLDRR